MTPVEFCKKAACLFFCWCAFLPFSVFAGVMFQKDYVIKQDMGNRIWCEPYVVQKNDSLTRIIQEKGGIIDENPEEFLKIFKRLNPQVIDLENMRSGQQIYIPLKKMDPEAERSNSFSTLPTGTTAVKKTQPTSEPERSSRIFTLPMVTISAEKARLTSEPGPPSGDNVFTEYKIKPGDTLTQIFHRYFGFMNAESFSEKLRMFQKINPDISDINRIYPGQSIRMPTVESTEDSSAFMENRAGTLERVAVLLNAQLTRKGVTFFPMPGKADFRLDLAQCPIMEYSDGLRVLFNPGQALMNDEQIIIRYYWPEVKFVDISYDASFDEVLEQVLNAAPYLRELLGRNSRAVAEPLQMPLPSSAMLPTGGHLSVRGKQQLVETLMRILGISYTKNVEISFPYADVQITSRANWIESGKGKPVLLDFGSFYGDAVQALEKSGFVVIQFLGNDSVQQGIPRLLNAIGISFTRDPEIQPPGQPPREVPGIRIQRNALPSLILTDAVLDPQMIQAIQEKGIILITEMEKTG